MKTRKEPRAEKILQATVKDLAALGFNRSEVGVGMLSCAMKLLLDEAGQDEVVRYFHELADHIGSDEDSPTIVN